MEPLAVASDLEVAVCLVERQAMRTVMTMIFRLPARILGTRFATAVGLIWILLPELLIIVVQCFKSRDNVKRWLAAGEGAVCHAQLMVRNCLSAEHAEPARKGLISG
jgi:hypothetical protein